MIGNLEIISFKLYRNYKTWHQTLNANVNGMWMRPAAYYGCELLNLRWWTTKSGMIITKHVLWYWHCLPMLLGWIFKFLLFDEATKRGKQTLPVNYQTIPTNGTFFFSLCLWWQSEQDWLKFEMHKLLELSTNQNRNVSC